MNEPVLPLLLLGPILLLACCFIPRGRTAWLRNLGPLLPVPVLAGGLQACLALVLRDDPAALRASFAAEGPMADLTFVLVDRLSAVMLLLIGFLGVVIGRYSRNYLEGEPNEGFFHKWFCITLGAIVCVILSGNLLLFTLAWMATSLSLHHLLLFYPERPAARLAAKKKFVISRIGDLCLIAAVAATGITFGSLDFPVLFERAEAVLAGQTAHPDGNLRIIGLFLALGALLKSAQFPFHTWLPDTLETPTPVSALMHAGIINAGGYLIIRLSPLVVLSAPGLTLLALLGAFTAVFAGLVMLTQTSVKKSLAFSTVAQMGFMMLQCGLGAFALALVHIVAHSLYKAHAFLASGQVPGPRAATPAPRAAQFVPAILLGAAAFTGVHFLADPFFERPAYILVLGFIVILGLIHLLHHHFTEARPGAAGMARAALTAVALSAVYALLHGYGRQFLDGTVAAPPPADTPAHIALHSAIAGLFALGFALPLWAARSPENPLPRKIQIHASHGFYCNTWINRLFLHKETGPILRRPATDPGTAAPETDPAIPDPAIDEACGRIAPLWPLHGFVAVNPFLGYSGNDFDQAAVHLHHVTGTQILPAPGQSRDPSGGATGDLSDAALEDALAEAANEVRETLANAGIPPRPEAIRAAAAEAADTPAAQPGIPTYTAFFDGAPNGYWHRFFNEDLSRRCAAYYDRAQAAWPPVRNGRSLYTFWRAAFRDDRNPDVAGIPGFRDAVRRLPDCPRETIARALRLLRVPEALHADFLHAQLFSLRGWAGYCQYLRHEARLRGGDQDDLTGLLAILLSYDALLHQATSEPDSAARWRARLDQAAAHRPAITPDLALRAVLQNAREHNRRRQLFRQLTASAQKNHETATSAANPETARPTLQAVFCIDVRSEIYRRALEAQSPEIATIGFAGFFGLPLAHRERTGAPATARCPVLLAPALQTCPADGPLHPNRHKAAWTAFQKDAPSCFPFVETVGLAYAWKSLRDSFPRPADATPGSGPPKFDEAPALHTRAETAATILRHLGLARNPGRYVLLAGHGAHSTNNPHASGLDCGACGGHPGDVNARALAALLNDPALRRALADRHGIHLPEDTRFLAGIHNTTTDELTLFPELADGRPAPDVPGFIRDWLRRASGRARLFRAPALGLGGPSSDPHRAIRLRARDWSQTRPEWGLAGNDAFIAAPRERTRNLDLDGRVFLHNYDPADDPGDRTLALILTAPVIVASWINLQYYGSTVDNARFGAGSKVIHNIAAGLGVLAGNGGDLLPGLPRQSLEVPDRPIHTPHRLHVCIEADPEAIDAVLADNRSIRELVDNRWLHLFALADAGRTIRHRRAGGGWTSAHPASTPAMS